MSQQIQSLCANRPMLLGVVIAGSLGAIVLAVAYWLGQPAKPVIGAAATHLTEAATAPAVETLSLMERGNRASALGNLFAPAGVNALELFLNARDQQEPGAEHAVLELLPSAIMQFDVELKQQSFDQAQLLLALINRADPKSPVLASLQTKLQAFQQAETLTANQPVAPIVAADPTPPAAPPAPVLAAIETPRTPTANSPEPSQAEPPASENNPPAPSVVPTVTSITRVPAPVEKAKVPRLIAAPAPMYPANAKRSKMEGWVDLRLTLDASGAVSDAEVIQSQPSGIFDMAAKRAAKRYRFEASEQSSVVRQRVQFKIRG